MEIYDFRSCVQPTPAGILCNGYTDVRPGRLRVDPEFPRPRSLRLRLVRRMRSLAPEFRAVNVSLIVLALVSAGLYAQETASAVKQPGWKLVWSDEFNGPNNSAVNLSKWTFDIGGEGWGNQELEYYTSRPQNVFIQDGNLVIRAHRENYTGLDGVSKKYTSGRLKTAGKFSQAFGRFEARVKIPVGQGMWPAFWMLGDDIEKVGWPACGEIDIMENIGKEPGMVHGSIHGPGFVGGDGIEASYTLPAKRRFADDFHIFAVEWEPNAIRFYVDQDLYITRTRSDLRPGWKWVFDHPFFVLLNLAVGGDWPGNPDLGTVFPQNMLVDYVRVYQRANP
jgi:beta-glucanase (GH16 family)